MWTPRALASEARAWSGQLWRVVESQSRISTMKLVDTVAEQAFLEAVLDSSKPMIPASCDGLHYLLATPFRYAPYRTGSRFRRAGQRDGCFYAAERVETALSEEAFYRLRFFLDSPATKRPENPQERTAFRIDAATENAIDLTEPRLDHDAADWTHLTNYAPCQDLADLARTTVVEAIRYRSVRDPDGGANLALLSPAAFRRITPDVTETWRIFLRPTSAVAVRDMPRQVLEIPFAMWATDPRVADRLPG